jgi:DNA adenine methylase
VKYNCSPFVKWVGGKRKLLKELESRIPKFERYFEPFIGGGALLFHLQPEKAYISDINSELINLYKTIRDDVENLISDLEKHIHSEEYFYEIRNLDRKDDFEKASNIFRASRFLYLNKSAFNGLYRVNRKGEFNVPFGRYKNPIYAIPENLRECSKFLKKVEIRNGDFEKFSPKEGDFFYLDPPYFPVSETSNFTSYSKDGFSFQEQKRLLDFAKRIDENGGKFLLSNSYSDEVLEFYKDFEIEVVEMGRSINNKGTGRGKVKEVLVANYQIEEGNLFS